MTPDERKLLNDLADNVSQAPASQPDPEAADIIRTRIGKRPDALYIMTQTVLIQNLALQRAQQQLRDLQGRLGQGSSGSFLGQQGSASGANYGGNQGYAAPQQPQYASAPPQAAATGGGGGFLRGAAQTAAGVAAGTLAAEAIGSMFGHGGGLFGGGGSGFMGGDAPREEIVNNYYDSPQGGDYQTGDAGNQFLDPGDANDNSGFDNSSLDDNSQFDDSGLDNGGGFDGGDDSMFS